MNSLTVLMYHYIRPLQRSRFPAIKGLDVNEFREQIGYLKQHYTIVPMEDVVAALGSGVNIPPRAAVLTFDDGYSDHYEHAFPVLLEQKLQGSFYVPRSTALDREILDVNKIHFFLAATKDHVALAAEVARLTDAARERFALPSGEDLRSRYWVPNRYDPAEVNYVKRLLQHALPPALRAEIASELFRRHVTTDFAAFSDELYMSLDQMRVMAQAGMHFGGHGDRHLWMSRSSSEEQAREAAGAVELLDTIGVEATARTYCYPYGDYDPACVDILRAGGFQAAFTARPGLAFLSENGAFEIPRLDTNDLPKRSDTAPNSWTKRAT